MMLNKKKVSRVLYQLIDSKDIVLKAIQKWMEHSTITSLGYK